MSFELATIEFGERKVFINRDLMGKQYVSEQQFWRKFLLAMSCSDKILFNVDREIQKGEARVRVSQCMKCTFFIVEELADDEKSKKLAAKVARLFAILNHLNTYCYLNNQLLDELGIRTLSHTVCEKCLGARPRMIMEMTSEQLSKGFDPCGGEGRIGSCKYSCQNICAHGKFCYKTPEWELRHSLADKVKGFS